MTIRLKPTDTVRMYSNGMGYDVKIENIAECLAAGFKFIK